MFSVIGEKKWVIKLFTIGCYFKNDTWINSIIYTIMVNNNCFVRVHLVARNNKPT